MADAHRAVPDLDVGIWLLARGNASQPEPHVILRLPQRALVVPLLDLFLWWQLQVDARSVDLEIIAPDVDGALLADEPASTHQWLFHALSRIRQVQMNLDSVSVAERHGALWVFHRPEFHGPGSVHAQRPLDLVDAVSAPVSRLAARIILIPH